MNWNTEENKELVKAILYLRTTGEVENFLRDLLTEGEITEFAKRFKTAGMLYEGMSYSKIEKETGFSSTTVARVSKWLNNGKGGYTSLLKKLGHHNSFKVGKGLS